MKIRKTYNKGPPVINQDIDFIFEEESKVNSSLKSPAQRQANVTLKGSLNGVNGMVGYKGRTEVESTPMNQSHLVTKLPLQSDLNGQNESSFITNIIGFKSKQHKSPQKSTLRASIKNEREKAAVNIKNIEICERVFVTENTLKQK